MVYKLIVITEMMSKRYIYEKLNKTQNLKYNLSLYFSLLMVVFGKNWEDFNSHPGNPRGYPKCTSTVGIPRPIAPLLHYPHPATPWSTTKGYKYCGIIVKHGVRMSFSSSRYPPYYLKMHI